MVAPVYLNAQFFGMSLSYIYDDHIGTSWYNSRGVQFGLGGEGYQLDGAPISISSRSSFTLTSSKYKHQVDSIEFDLPEGSDPWGFGTVKFRKFSIGYEIDVGYSEDEYQAFEPYASLGVVYNSFDSNLSYDLYNPDTCACYSTAFAPFTNTQTLGMKTGLGFKIRLSESFYFDFRSSYSGTWVMRNKSPNLPDINSFDINYKGDAVVDYSPRKYVHGFSFRAGIIFKLDFTGVSWSSSSSDNSSSDDDWDDDDDNDSDSGSGGSSGRECGPLSPKGSRGGR